MSYLECMACNEPFQLMIFLFHIHVKALDQVGSFHNRHMKLLHLHKALKTEIQCIDLLPAGKLKKPLLSVM